MHFLSGTVALPDSKNSNFSLVHTPLMSTCMYINNEQTITIQKKGTIGNKEILST